MQFKKETYSIQAAAYIRNLIRSGALKPGQPVREAQISEELNISRAPIREALGLDAHSRVLCVSTEGDTDPGHYRAIVWEGQYPSI